MAFKTFTDGSALSAAELNTYLMKQSVVVCTSGTRPTPVAGMTIYETDTSNTLVYHSVTTGWKPPWSTAWGYVAGGTSSSDQTGITTVVDIAGMTSGSFTAIATRRYLTTVFVPRIQQHTAPGEVNVLLTDGAGTFLTLASSTAPATNTTFAGMQWQEAGLSGATTRKARIQTSAGNCDVDGASYPGQIIVQDIGPSGVAP